MPTGGSARSSSSRCASCGSGFRWPRVNVHRKPKTVASARLRGNGLFKVSKFAEACAACGEGLDRETSRAVLLYNRAACHAKLRRYEKAIEDCNGTHCLAAGVQQGGPTTTSRFTVYLPRLEKWEAPLGDYQVLIQQLPENEDVKKALSEVEAKLKNQRNGADLSSDVL